MLLFGDFLYFNKKIKINYNFKPNIYKNVSLGIVWKPRFLK